MSGYNSWLNLTLSNLFFFVLMIFMKCFIAFIIRVFSTYIYKICNIIRMKIIPTQLSLMKKFAHLIYQKNASVIVRWVVKWVSNNCAVSFYVLFLVPETFLISITVNKSHALKHPYLLKFIEVYYNISHWSSKNVLLKYWNR